MRTLFSPPIGELSPCVGEFLAPSLLVGHEKEERSKKKKRTKQKWQEGECERLDEKIKQ